MDFALHILQKNYHHQMVFKLKTHANNTTTKLKTWLVTMVFLAWFFVK